MNPVNVAGVNALIWAHSLVGNQSVDYHAGKRGSLIVDFSCSGGDTYTPSVPVPATGGGAVGQQPGAGGNCPPSYITGYQHLVQLDGNGLVLHWRTPVNGVLNLVLEATKTSAAYGGWVSVGWSQTGAMAPADAVVGSLTKGVAAYHIDGYRARNVYTTSAFSLGRNATVLTSPWSKSLIVKFSIAQGQGTSLNVAGLNTLIWAYSSGQTVAYHGGNCGTVSVDFSCATPPSGSDAMISHDAAKRSARSERRRNRQEYYWSVWKGVWGSLV
eukprot:TRINITY_DN24290_c0_g1_i7.p1 TRINITY_DN24290_c0_g1~~TRINITY_DN24290_c0_g1_i7.p1  ORF type:complete len:304 (+),score=-9.19 TRINITY_DN24290_c0_g1_i7:100-912(+)